MGLLPSSLLPPSFFLLLLSLPLYTRSSGSAMTNEVIWLIVISFFFARGFVKTGLGDRVATYFVKWFGKSTLGLAYGLAGKSILKGCNSVCSV